MVTGFCYLPFFKKWAIGSTNILPGMYNAKEAAIPDATPKDSSPSWTQGITSLV